jgi:hypothetical protein
MRTRLPGRRERVLELLEAQRPARGIDDLDIEDDLGPGLDAALLLEAEDLELRTGGGAAGRDRRQTEGESQREERAGETNV